MTSTTGTTVQSSVATSTGWCGAVRMPIPGAADGIAAAARRRAARRVPDEQLERTRPRQRRTARGGGRRRRSRRRVSAARRPRPRCSPRRCPRAAGARLRGPGGGRGVAGTRLRGGGATRPPTRSWSAGTAISTSSGCAAPPTRSARRVPLRRDQRRPDLSRRRRAAARRGFDRRRGRDRGRAAARRSRASPKPSMVALVRDRYGDPAVMIGDRPSTDGEFAADARGARLRSCSRGSSAPTARRRFPIRRRRSWPPISARSHPG